MPLPKIPNEIITASGDVFGGWIDSPPDVERALSEMPIPLITDMLAPAYDPDKTTLLYEIFRKVTNSELPKGPQGIGDCVGWGWSQLVNLISSIEISMGAPFKFELTAVESIYGASRCEIGKQWNSYSDGSVGAWAARAITTLGTLSYPALLRLGEKLGVYSKERSKLYGAKGLPDAYEPEARQRIVKATSLVTNYEDAAALIQSGYPVVVCSNQGFTMTRDAEGYCQPKGRWNHCMIFIAVRADARKGLCCLQSWGKNTPSGPTAHNQPDNSFWVEPKTANYMLSQRDSFTGSSLLGYPGRDLDYSH